jgi:hypothetical protein
MVGAVGVTMMHIGVLAQRAGVSRRSLRYYEQHGLLALRTEPQGLAGLQRGRARPSGERSSASPLAWNETWNASREGAERARLDIMSVIGEPAGRVTPSAPRHPDRRRRAHDEQGIGEDSRDKPPQDADWFRRCAAVVCRREWDEPQGRG